MKTFGFYFHRQQHFLLLKCTSQSSWFFCLFVLRFFFAQAAFPSLGRSPLVTPSHQQLFYMLLRDRECSDFSPRRAPCFCSASPVNVHSITCHSVAVNKQVSMQYTLSGLSYTAYCIQYYIPCPSWEPMDKNISLITCSAISNENLVTWDIQYLAEK